MNTKINVNPELLNWAVTRSGLSLDDFKEPVQDWIQGKSQPTIGKLEKFARKAMVPFGFLFLSSPPNEEIGIPDFRTFNDKRRTTISPNLRDVITDIRRRQVWMRDYLIDAGSDPLSIVGSLSIGTNVEQAADRIRKELKLSSDWQSKQTSWESALSTLRKAIERIGIFVCMTNQVGLNTRRPLDHKEFRGFVLIDEFAPWLFVNTNDTKSAQMFTFAHEIVHVWVGRPGLFNLEQLQPHEDNLEQFCNRVAAELLIPAEGFNSAWQGSGSFRDRCETLSRHFKVSPLVVARRAFELKLISSRSFFDFYQEELSKWQDLKELKKNEPAPVFWKLQDLRLGDRFGYAVASAYAERRLLPSDAQDLTGFSRETFAKYAGSILKKVNEGDR